MPFDPEHSRSIFEKLQRHLSKLSDKAVPESVHRFRTYSRRVEAVLGEVVEKPSGNEKRLLKSLAWLRKKAGRVRDLDVQIALLRSLKLPQEPGRKSQLLRQMADERIKREKKLRKAFDEDTVREIRKRLKRAAKETVFSTNIDPAQAALRLLAAVGQDNHPLTEKIMHQYRIAGKRARYVAELAGNDPRAEQVAASIKRLQDVIGDWHDWLKLTARAEKLFGGTQDSALVAALKNVTRAKFRHAVSALAETKAALLGKPAATEQVPAKRFPQAIRGDSAA